MKPIKRTYGWKRQLPDYRDVPYSLWRLVTTLPATVDLVKDVELPTFDQGTLGSCTANAISMALYFEQLKQKTKETFLPSRLFIYYNERAMEGTIKQDAGAVIRDGFKTVAQLGACPEDQWKYDISKFRNKPTKTCYKHAMDHQALVYGAVPQNLIAIQDCLAAGYPFVFGFSVYESFQSREVARTGIMPMPKRNESLLGGHAVMAVGYDNKTKMVKVKNSWGDRWGDNGHFYMPYAFITNLGMASDFWKVTLVEGEVT